MDMNYHGAFCLVTFEKFRRGKPMVPVHRDWFNINSRPETEERGALVGKDGRINTITLREVDVNQDPRELPRMVINPAYPQFDLVIDQGFIYTGRDSYTGKRTFQLVGQREKPFIEPVANIAPDEYDENGYNGNGNNGDEYENPFYRDMVVNQFDRNGDVVTLIIGAINIDITDRDVHLPSVLLISGKTFQPMTPYGQPVTDIVRPRGGKLDVFGHVDILPDSQLRVTENGRVIFHHESVLNIYDPINNLHLGEIANTGQPEDVNKPVTIIRGRVNVYGDLHSIRIFFENRDRWIRHGRLIVDASSIWNVEFDRGAMGIRPFSLTDFDLELREVDDNNRPRRLINIHSQGERIHPDGRLGFKWLQGTPTNNSWNVTLSIQRGFAPLGDLRLSLIGLLENIDRNVQVVGNLEVRSGTTLYIKNQLNLNTDTDNPRSYEFIMPELYIGASVNDSKRVLLGDMELIAAADEWNRHNAWWNEQPQNIGSREYPRSTSLTFEDVVMELKAPLRDHARAAARNEITYNGRTIFANRIRGIHNRPDTWEFFTLSPAECIVRPRAKVLVDDLATIVLDRGGRLVIEEGAIVELEGDTNHITRNSRIVCSETNGTQTVLFINGTLIINDLEFQMIGFNAMNIQFGKNGKLVIKNRHSHDHQRVLFRTPNGLNSSYLYSLFRRNIDHVEFHVPHNCGIELDGSFSNISREFRAWYGDRRLEKAIHDRILIWEAGAFINLPKYKVNENYVPGSPATILNPNARLPEYDFEIGSEEFHQWVNTPMGLIWFQSNSTLRPDAVLPDRLGFAIGSPEYYFWLNNTGDGEAWRRLNLIVHPDAELPDYSHMWIHGPDWIEWTETTEEGRLWLRENQITNPVHWQEVPIIPWLDSDTSLLMLGRIFKADGSFDNERLQDSVNRFVYAFAKAEYDFHPGILFQLLEYNTSITYANGEPILFAPSTAFKGIGLDLTNILKRRILSSPRHRSFELRTKNYGNLFIRNLLTNRRPESIVNSTSKRITINNFPHGPGPGVPDPDYGHKFGEEDYRITFTVKELNQHVLPVHQ